MSQQGKIITLQNVDDEDFMFEYNSSEGNPPYLIPSGETARFPYVLANHAMKHLINKILTKRKQKTNNQTLRDELANEIVIGEETAQREAQVSETERLRLEVEDLNKPRTLDTILEKREAEKENKEKIEKTEKDKIKVGEKFEGLDETPDVSKAKKKVEKPKNVKPIPTRSELMDYAKNEMNMVLDEKTEKRLSKMKIDDLVKELNYSK